MNDIERQRLVGILGMLGSASAGERDNAARLAEQFRRRHNLTWTEMVEGKTIYVSREVVVEKPIYVDRIVERPAPVYFPRRPPTSDRRMAFHEAGEATFSDWRRRCDDLMAMGSYQRAYPITAIAQARLVREAMRPGIRISLFQASQQAAMMAS
jgi:hypothetical protein